MLSKLGFPDVGPHRRFVGALAIDAIGSGIWMPLSMLYFLHQTSLGLVRLGLAMTIANTVVIPLVTCLGVLVDRIGPKRVMQAGNAGAAVAFLLYPFAHSLWAVTVLVFVASLTRTAFWSALGPMVTGITEPGEREVWFGFLQAMRNAGFGVGGVLAAVAALDRHRGGVPVRRPRQRRSYVVAVRADARGGRRGPVAAPARPRHASSGRVGGVRRPRRTGS